MTKTRRTHIVLFNALIIVSCVFSSCNSNKNKVDISEFNVTKNALANQEEVLVLACSENPENGKEDYLIHMLVQSVKTGDTVNVLFHGPREVYGQEIKSFIAPDDIFFKANRAADFDIQAFKQVYSNPEFIPTDWRKYPIILGDDTTLYDTNEKSTDELIDGALEYMQHNQQ